jgi:hypothetical protein
MGDPEPAQPTTRQPRPENPTLENSTMKTRILTTCCLALVAIAATRADSIVSARPYASIHEIILVEGVGNATFEKILAHGKTLTQRTTVAANETRKS